MRRAYILYDLERIAVDPVERENGWIWPIYNNVVLVGPSIKDLTDDDGWSLCHWEFYNGKDVHDPSKKVEDCVPKDMAARGFEMGWPDKAQQPVPANPETGTKQQYGTGTPSDPFRYYKDPKNPPWMVPGMDDFGDVPGPANLPQTLVGLLLPGMLGLLASSFAGGLGGNSGTGNPPPQDPGDSGGPQASPSDGSYASQYNQALMDGNNAQADYDKIKKQLEEFEKSADKSDPNYEKLKKQYDDYLAFKQQEMDDAAAKANAIAQAVEDEKNTRVLSDIDGRIKRVIFDPKTGLWHDLDSGALFDPDKWDQFQKDLANQKAFSLAELDKMSKGQDANSLALMAKLDAIKKNTELNALYLRNVGMIQKSVFEKSVYNGPASDLFQPPCSPGEIIANCDEVANNILSGKPFDRQKYAAIVKLYVDTVAGKILAPDQMPKPNDIDNGVIVQGLTGTSQGVLNVATFGISNVIIDHDSTKGSLGDDLAVHAANFFTAGGYSGYKKGGLSGAGSAIVHNILPIDEAYVLADPNATWDQKAGAIGTGILKVLTLGKLSTAVELPGLVKGAATVEETAVAGATKAEGLAVGAATKAEGAAAGAATKAEAQTASAAGKAEGEAAGAATKKGSSENTDPTPPRSEAPPTEAELKKTLDEIKNAGEARTKAVSGELSDEERATAMTKQSPIVQKLDNNITEETSTVVVNGEDVQVAKTYVDKKGALEQLTDTAGSREAKMAPADVQEAIINTRIDKIYGPADKATIEAVGQDARVKAMMGEGDELVMDRFQTPGKTGESLGADRDARLVIKHPDGKMTEVDRGIWENQAYEDFYEHTSKIYKENGGIPAEIQQRVSQRAGELQYLKGEGLSEEQIYHKAWAEEHNQLFTDKYHIEASTDNSDQIGVLSKGGDIPGKKTVENVTLAKGGEATLQDPEGFAKMWQEKSHFYENNPAEAIAQSQKGIGQLLEVRGGYLKQGLVPPKLPDPVAHAMDVIIKAPTGMAATPEAMANVNNQLKSLGFDDMHDAMGKIASQFENLKWSKPTS